MTFDRWCIDPGMVAVSVGYRLSPETPYPGALEDCYRSLVWAVENAEALGIDPTCMGCTERVLAAGWPPGWPCWPRTGASACPSSSCSTP